MLVQVQVLSPAILTNRQFHPQKIQPVGPGVPVRFILGTADVCDCPSPVVESPA